MQPEVERLRKLLARDHLLGYTGQTFKGYKPSWHHVLIARKLEGIATTPASRLIITMPPRHGKTELASVRFAPWLLSRRPQASIIAATYAQDFADELGRKARAVMQSPVHRWLAPQACLAQDNRAVSRWMTVAGGSYYAVGVGGPLTGRGANVLLIDDPHKNRAEAESKTARDTVWDWFRSTAYTRLEQGGSVVIIMCMTGDTPVLLPDGAEKPLRDIRPGDQVATYENGSLATSTVVNWANQGPDDLFRVRMKSGRVVRANARHPFLTINEHGEEEWVRTDQIQPGVSILTVTGASGGESPVPWTGATRPRGARGCVCHTIQRPNGQQARARHRSILSRVARLVSNIVTSSLTNRLNVSFPSRTGIARSAGSLHRPRTSVHTGTGSCASTTTTTPAEFADCCATTAISQSATERPRESSAPLLNTWSVTPDEVLGVDACGREDVYDLQIDRTENFIANGLVSHNTRWHEDDLVGRCLQTGEPWEVLSLPAIAEQDEPHRRPGDALWPDKYSVETLEQIRRTVGEREWAALYQQRPAPLDGALFKPDQLQAIDAEPAGVEWVRAWDFGATRDGDPTVGAKLGLRDGRPIIADIVRLQGPPEVVERTLLATASRDGSRVKIDLPQDPGQAGKSQVQHFTRLLAGYTVRSSPETGDKVLRAEPLAAQVNVGNVSMVRGAWNQALIDEMRSFPNGSHDDQVDALSRAYGHFVAPTSAGILDYYRQLAER